MRKQLEQHFEAVMQERNQLAERMQQAQMGLNPPQPPDKELLKTDPIGYWEQRAEYEEQASAYQQQVQEYQQFQIQQQQYEQQRHAQATQQGLQELQKMDPDFSTPEKARETSSKVMKIATEAYGMPAEMVQSIVHPGAIAALNDARKWRELQALKGTAAKKAQSARPMKPSARRADTNASKEKRAAEKMRKTGSIEDVANFLLTGN